jgi:hypothetical protein
VVTTVVVAEEDDVAGGVSAPLGGDAGTLGPSAMDDEPSGVGTSPAAEDVVPADRVSDAVPCRTCQTTAVAATITANTDTAAGRARRLRRRR